MSIDLPHYPHYYDRFDPADNYERHLFLAGNVLQAAELNELQSAAMHRLQSVTNALMKEGDVLSGAIININAETGATTITGGAIYLRGAVRGIPAGTLTLPVIGTVSVGVYLVDLVVTELEDPRLLDPAVSYRNYQDPGAARLRVNGTWGYAGDGQPGDFYPVYKVEDGLLIGNVPPPQVDAIAQTVARYDRQSVGGYYVSSGMTVARLEDYEGLQVYSVAEGVARVGGEEIVRQHARRFYFDARPDIRNIENEPHLASGGTERITANWTPIHSIEDVSVLREETTSLTHGVSGSMDIIYAPDGLTQRTSIVNIVSCSQTIGETTTTYVKGVDYKLTNGRVDWSLAPTAPEGEPGVGDTYTCVFQYRDTYVPDPEDQDDTGLTVTGAVVGSEILLSYAWALPRYDLICLNATGDLVGVKGVSASFYPRVPAVPTGLLGLAVLEQRWDATSAVVNNAPRMVPMNQLNRMGQNIDTLFALIAEQRLTANLSQRDLPAKKGVFADPFLNDNLRDQGLAQTAATVNGELTLGVQATVFTHDLGAPMSLVSGDPVAVIDQPLRTGTHLINPYDTAIPLPAGVTLSPAVDEWEATTETWLSPITQRFQEPDLYARYGGFNTWQTSAEETVGSTTVAATYLRPIEVAFTVTHFNAGEELHTVLFDGLSVPFTSL